ncbi:MSMEG_0570 family nitrogen starvation response protein [Pantoea cypripedii]|uniref:MSMEG_0570 family nitrogen starvation response protein n=1 Tax=Pantoea cypripedii TaxID=55209 RepID=UPI002FCB1E5D
MPAMHFVVCWPDGSKDTCYSPSTAIEKHLAVNHPYALEEFVTLSTRALDEASERVKAKFGYYCSSAQDQSAVIVQKARQFTAQQQVIVEKITPVPV